MQIKTSLSIYLIIILSIIGGIWNAQYINDGYHWGFIFSNSIEFLNGKKPFEEIFIEYGFLHILINSFIISIFGESVFLLQIFTILIYSLSFFYISRIIFFYTKNDLLTLIAIVLIFCIYPWPTSPWPVYYAYFFSILFIFYAIKKDRISIFLSGLFLFCAYLSLTTLFNFIILFFIFFLLILSIIWKLRFGSFFLEKFIRIFFIFFLLSIFFIAYLKINNVFDIWLNYQTIPFIVKDSLNLSFKDLIYDYFNFLFIYSLFNIVYEPQWVFYSILFLSNIILLFVTFLNIVLYNKKDKIDFLYIILFIFLLNFVSQTKNLMYIACSLSAAIICLSILYNEIKSKENKLILSFILSFIIFLSFLNFDMNNSKYAEGRYKSIKYLKEKTNITNYNFSYFKYFKWKRDYWLLLEKISDKIKIIENKCPGIKSINLTSDSYLILLLKDNFQKIPFYLSDNKIDFNSLFDPYLDKKIKEQLKTNNLIILTHKNNEISYEINSDFIIEKISYDTGRTIADEIRIISPKNCN